jgi:hypothetical protein
LQDCPLRIQPPASSRNERTALGLARAFGYDGGMANHIRIPLYKLLFVAVVFTAAIFGGFFSVRHGYGQNDAADIVFAATAGTIMALYFLCRRGAVMSVGLIASLGALSGFRWSGSAHFKGEEPSISSGLFGAFIGAIIGVLVGCLVIASRSWGESRNTQRLD